MVHPVDAHGSDPVEKVYGGTGAFEATRRGSVAWPMTMLCAVATGKDAASLLTGAKQALGEGADMVELRLDHLSDPRSDLPEVAKAMRPGGQLADARVAISLRAPADGGAFAGEEDERLAVLADAAATGADWVDLEGHLPEPTLTDLAERVRAAGSRVLLSSHMAPGVKLEGVTSWAVKACRSGMADGVKVVVPVKDREELDNYLDLAGALDGMGIRHVVLPSGGLSRIGRMLAPITGAMWVYVETRGTGYTGPLGLPLLDEISAAWACMSLVPDVDRPPRSQPPLAPSDASGEWTLIAILGDPVAHTKSPVVHQAAMRALGLRGAYVPYRTGPGDVAKALLDLRAAGAVGCNVTIPLKVEAVAAVDRLGKGARLSGAVNTIVLEGGGTVRGENTDVDGVRTTATELMGPYGQRMTALVLGTGGAARGAAVGMGQWGAKVLVTGRTPESLESIVGDLGGLAKAVSPDSMGSLQGKVDILVQCTSQGMEGVPPEGPLAPMRVFEAVRPRAVMDLVYHLGGTELVRKARFAGLPAAGGERVLLHQAVEAFRHWTDLEPPVREMERTLMRAIVAETKRVTGGSFL
jgi:shikimate dehydrogenase